MPRQERIPATDPERGFADAAPQAYRDAMQYLAGGVSVITVGAADGRMSGFTATAVMSLSSDPPAVAVGISRDSYSYALIAEAGRFCVNILGEGQRKTAEIFAGRANVRGEARFGKLDWTHSPLGNPALVDALARFDCNLEDVTIYGTHALVIGRVGQVATRASGYPIIYWARDFRHIENARQQ